LLLGWVEEKLQIKSSLNQGSEIVIKKINLFKSNVNIADIFFGELNL